MPAGWEGERVRLVAPDKQKHFENALQWINDSRITQWTLIGDLPISRLAEEEYFDRVMKGDPNVYPDKYANLYTDND